MKMIFSSFKNIENQSNPINKTTKAIFRLYTERTKFAQTKTLLNKTMQ